MAVNELKKISKAIQEKTGLLYTEDKLAVFQKKIDDRLKELKLHDYTEYLNYLVLDNQNSEFNKLINILTVNETFFFRHYQQFETLKNIILPGLKKNNKTKTIKIWSAACANGCEVYSIAIIVREMFEYLKAAGIEKVEILGTDISSEMIEFAEKGIFSKRCVSTEMPKNYLVKYFNKISEEKYLIKGEIKNMVIFRTLNLKNYMYPKDLDVIFFRNVLYYFDSDSQYKIAVKIYESLKRGGSLFLGGTEICRYYEYFESTQINDTVYYSKWSTDRRYEENSDYNRIPSWKWAPPIIKYDKINNEIILSGVFADNANIERIKNDIMFNASFTNFLKEKKIVLNFEKVRWITNDILSELKQMFKFYKAKDIEIIITVGNNPDILKWIKTAKFEEYVSVLLCSIEPIKNNESFYYNKKRDNRIKNTFNEKKSIKRVIIKKCNNEEINHLKEIIIDAINKSEDLLIDITKAESVSIELFDIVTKAEKAAESRINIKIIE